MDPRDDYRFPSRLKWLTWALAVIAIVALLMAIPMTDEAKSCWSDHPVNAKYCFELGFLKYAPKQ